MIAHVRYQDFDEQTLCDLEKVTMHKLVFQLSNYPCLFDRREIRQRRKRTGYSGNRQNTQQITNTGSKKQLVKQLKVLFRDIVGMFL